MTVIDHRKEYIKQSEAPVMLEFGGMQCIPSLPSLPSPLGPGVVALDRVPTIGKKV